MFINKAPNISIYKDMLLYRRFGALMVRDIPSTNNL